MPCEIITFALYVYPWPESRFRRVQILISTNMVRVRFAPSPTGALHIGGVRTALYNYLFARKMGGTMILRIEDTDSKRFVPGAEDYIIESLRWLGIEIDEGVGVGGPHGPYRQSERRDIYKKYVQQLLDSGRAYRAYDTAQELDAVREQFPNFQYDATTRLRMRNSLTLSSKEEEALLASGTPYVVRFLIEPGIEVHVQDLIRGEVVINSSVLDDKVLYKSADELPTYHLANIVDDHLMEVTHVIRGEEWLPSAPLHKLLYEAFGWQDTMPQFAHLSLLLKPDGNGKLSKRDGDRLGFPVFPLEWHPEGAEEPSMGFREKGYLPHALVNFLALLGWNPGDDREVMSLSELIEAFALDKCSKSGARFDIEKAKWFNHHYLQQMPVEELIPSVRAQLSKEVCTHFSDDYFSKAIDLVRDRASFVHEIAEQCDFFFHAPVEYDAQTVKKRWKPESPDYLHKLLDLLNGLTSFAPETIDEALTGWILTNALPMGVVMNSVRLALVGQPRGPHVHEIISLLGLKEVTRRIDRAIQVLTPDNHSC